MGWIAKDSILGLVGDCLYNSNGVERGVAGFVVKVIEFYTLRGKGFDLVPLSMPRSSSIIFTVTLSLAISTSAVNSSPSLDCSLITAIFT